MIGGAMNTENDGPTHLVQYALFCVFQEKSWQELAIRLAYDLKIKHYLFSS